MRLLLLTVLVFLAPFAAPPAYCADCGVKPIRPVRPIGCRGEMVARCVCDSHGKNCAWVWECEGDR